MKIKIATVLFASTLLTGLALAQGGGMMGPGGSGGAMGGAGMLTVADDGSLLVTEMSAMMGGPGSPGMGDDRAIVNIAPDGSERWRATFSDGWPMRPVTDGDLVVLALREEWWGGWDGSGDGGWHHGGGHGGGGGGGGTGPYANAVTLVGLDLATGSELWRTVVEGGMVSLPQFAPDGSRMYLTVREFASDGGALGGDPMHQGDAPGFFQLMSTTVVALGRDGTVLWSIDLGTGGPGGGGGP